MKDKDKENTIAQALDLNIISAEQAEKLNELQSENNIKNNEQKQQPEDEQLHFLQGFGGILISVSTVVFFSLLVAVTPDGLYHIVILAIIGASEWMVKRKRLNMPGIILLLFAMVYIYFTLQREFGFQYDGLDLYLMMLIVPVLYYWRYKLPFSVFIIAILVFLSFIQFVAVLENTGEYLETTILDLFNNPNNVFYFIVYGFVLFAIAMWFDSKDLTRETTYSDIAFWLHLISASFIVHSIMYALLFDSMSFDSMMSTNNQVQVVYLLLAVIFCIIFVLVAIFVDRRAMLLSSLFYIFLSYIIGFDHGDIGSDQTITMLMLYSAISMVASIYWHDLRCLLYARFADKYLAKYVPKFINKVEPNKSNIVS